MYSNPSFSFPGRKDLSASPAHSSTTANQPSHHARRSSNHSRQFSVSSNVSSPSSPVKASMSRPPSGSHHRRRSSVSSRRESHEMMGITLPPESQDDKHSGDSRQRALWALEGKKSAGPSMLNLGFTKVEIPEWNTPDGDKDGFSWSPSSPVSLTGSSSKPPAPVGSSSSAPSFSYGLTSSLANKRDSFGKSLIAASSSLKAELHTLLEEDEDEDGNENGDDESSQASPQETHTTAAITEDPVPLSEDDTDDTFRDASIETPVVGSPPSLDSLLATPVAPSSQFATYASTIAPPATSSSPRHRPASLTLRPLSLVPSLQATTSTSGVPATISHSPRLKSLTLTTNLPPSSTTQTRNANEVARRRHSLLMNGVTVGPSSPTPAPVAVNANTTSLSRAERQRRRGSMGYRRSGDDVPPSSSAHSLRRQSLPPTPGLTPNSAVTQRSASPSTPSDSISSSRASSEFFQSQAVASLLSRIASLEEALSTAATSPASERMSLPPIGKILESEECGKTRPHTDELVSVIADLKAERDELNSDITGWRTRCSDLTHSMEVLQRRLADERRELLLFHQRLSSLNSEVNIAKSAQAKVQTELATAQAALEAEKDERRRLDDDLNEEQTARLALEMRSNKERLAWLKEKEGWETERRGWIAERAELEQSLIRAEATVEKLKKELTEKSRQLRGSMDDVMTPKARSPWTGGNKPFAFPPMPTAAASTPLLDEPERPRTSSGFGGLNTGFKFGGAVPPLAVDTTPRPSVSLASPTQQNFDAPSNHGGLGVLTEEDEDEEENPLGGYEQEEEGDADADFGSLNSDDEHPFNAIPAPQLTPQSSPTAPPRHQHRRSASVVANWKFPSPRTVEQRRQTGSRVSPKVDRFFACLQEDDDGSVSEGKAPTLLGKPMKVKEHKKLPSGCPAFWMDCEEEEQVVRREVPLPSPAITEEESEGEEGDGESTPITTSMPFPFPARPSLIPNVRTATPPAAPTNVLPVPAKPAANRVSLRPASSSPQPRVAPPVFLPSPAASTPLPGPSTVPLTTIPPAARPAMVVPPTNVATDAFGSAPAKPVVAPTTSSYPMSFTSRLSSMISWTPTKKPAPLPTSSSASTSSLSSSGFGGSDVGLAIPGGLHSPTISPSHSGKLVDPVVMRERLRLQLEAEGKLPPKGSSKRSSRVPSPQLVFHAQPCAKCSRSGSGAVLEL